MATSLERAVRRKCKLSLLFRRKDLVLRVECLRNNSGNRRNNSRRNNGNRRRCKHSLSLKCSSNRLGTKVANLKLNRFKPMRRGNLSKVVQLMRQDGGPAKHSGLILARY